MANRREPAEGSERINHVFCDLSRHFPRAVVAKRRHLRAAIAAAMAVLVGGCAGMGGLSAEAPAEVKREAVAARATARWDRFIKLDIDGAYTFLSPASRATIPLDLYKAKHKLGMYRAVKVNEVNCEADACTVNLSLTYDHRQFKGITTPLVEKWIITQGQAWIVEQR